MSDDLYVPKTQKGWYGNGVLWVLGILAVIGLVALIVFGVRWITAPAKGKLQAREQINSGNFRIAAYDQFFNQCVSVQTKEAAIEALEQELATNPSAQRKEQINASLTANRIGRVSDIRQYNADAEKSYTVGQFRASKLPFQLDPTAKETTCVT